MSEVMNVGVMNVGQSFRSFGIFYPTFDEQNWDFLGSVKKVHLKSRKHEKMAKNIQFCAFAFNCANSKVCKKNRFQIKYRPVGQRHIFTRLPSAAIS